MLKQQASLAADGEDGNGLQFDKLRLNISSCFHASSKKSMLMAVVCFVFVNLRLYLPLDVLGAFFWENPKTDLWSQIIWIPYQQ